MTKHLLVKGLLTYKFFIESLESIFTFVKEKVYCNIKEVAFIISDGTIPFTLNFFQKIF